MKLHKWNPMLHKYEDFEVPDDREIALYMDDMDRLVQCANCGRWMRYGQGYTSRTIHTEVGFGYAVCENCYDEEYKEC